MEIKQVLLSGGALSHHTFPFCHRQRGQGEDEKAILANLEEILYYSNVLVIHVMGKGSSKEE